MKKKVAIITGGGSHGAEVVGVLSQLKPKYDVYIGTSTGALISTLAACGKHKELVEGYSNITNKEMYGVLNPIKSNGKLNKVKLSLALLNMIRKNGLSAYDITKALEKLVRKYFTIQDFDKIRNNGTEVIVTAQCIDHINEDTEFFSILDPTMYYDKWVHCVVASAAIPFISKPVKLDGAAYVDGGTSDPIPSSILFNRFENSTIWVYLMDSKRDLDQRLNVVDGMGELVSRLFGIQRNAILGDDLKKMDYLSQLRKAKGEKEPSIHLLWSTYKVESSANFDGVLTKKWIDMGINRAEIGLKWERI
jgi:predicted acylesterase/phospholipase RssA